VLDEDTAQRLERFRLDGGVVISLGDSPVTATETVSLEAIRRGIETRHQLPVNDPLSTAIARHLPPDVVIHRMEAGARARTAGVHFLHRAAAHEDYYFFFNLEEEAGTFEASLRAAGGVQRLDLDTGTEESYPSASDSAGTCTLNLTLEVGECQAFRITPAAPASGAQPAAPLQSVWHAAAAEAVRVLQPNGLPLHLWREGGQEKTPNALSKRGEISLTVADPLAEVEVWLPEALCGALAEFRVKETACSLPELAREEWLDAPYRVLPLKDVAAGELWLGLAFGAEVTEPLRYLPVFVRGRFAVAVEPGESAELFPHHQEYHCTSYLRPGQRYTLSREPEGLQLAPWETQGYPLYSGAVEYDFVLEVPEGAAGRPLTLDCGEVREVAEVFLAGQALGTRVWPPYRFALPADLPAGAHRLTIRVTNTSANLLEETPQQSGLLGPVSVEESS